MFREEITWDIEVLEPMILVNVQSVDEKKGMMVIEGNVCDTSPDVGFEMFLGQGYGSIVEGDFSIYCKMGQCMK